MVEAERHFFGSAGVQSELGVGELECHGVAWPDDRDHFADAVVVLDGEFVAVVGYQGFGEKDVVFPLPRAGVAGDAVGGVQGEACVGDAGEQDLGVVVDDAADGLVVRGVGVDDPVRPAVAGLVGGGEQELMRLGLDHGVGDLQVGVEALGDGRGVGAGRGGALGGRERAGGEDHG